jgi:iron complex outermembrane receptor protein
VAQALRYTPGVVPEQRGVNTDSLEYLYSRGFQAETYLDGLRQPAPGQAGFNIMSRDAYLIDHIESIRGPASILYGQAPPGGVFNIVSKLPQETPFNEVFFQTGSYGRAQGGFDTTGPLNDDKTLLYRVTGVGFNTGTQTDFIDQQRIAIAPSLTWKIDAATKLTITASYQNDPKAGIYNFVPAAGTVLPNTVKIPRSMNLGEPTFDQFKKQEANLGYQFEHQVNDIFQVKQNFRYTYNDIYTQEAGPSGLPLTNSGTTLIRTPYINSGVLNSFVIDNEAIARFYTGPVHHEVLVGTDYQNTEYDHYLFNGYVGGTTAPSLNLVNPVYGVAIPRPNNMLATSTAINLQQTGVYGQDQIGIGNFTILGGVRQDWAINQTTSFKTGAQTEQDTAATTGRAAIMYNFADGIAPYFSYATSFQPLAGTTDTGAPLKPTEGEQYEVGLKYQPPGTKSIFTVAAYDLRQTNVTVSNTLYIGSVIQTGEVRSRGIELEARTDVTNNLQAIAAYTYDDVENTQATPAMLGKAPVGIPLNMASLWLGYDMPANVAPGLKLSGGVRHLDNTWGDTANTFKVPAFTLFDIGLQYDFGRQFVSLRGLTGNINVTNLFDKIYISSCLSLTTCTFGAGRMVLAGLKYHW